MERILTLIGKGKEEGAKLLLGGSRHGNKGFYVQPTIFSNLQENKALLRLKLLFLQIILYLKKKF